MNKNNENNEKCEILQQQLNSYLKSVEKYNIEKKHFEKSKQKLNNLITQKKIQPIYVNHMTLEHILQEDPFFFS